MCVHVQTQRLHLTVEHNDLRLELALQERARIHAQRKLAGIQRDASEGVVDFEKNLMRLGLGGGSATGSSAQSLRAIPVNDEGALAHFRKLEQRVEELEFRPSNNVKMMKELRARRKAQLAAEKDRRMRRRKAGGDHTSSIPVGLIRVSALARVKRQLC